jgi:hypothetical protein
MTRHPKRQSRVGNRPAHIRDISIRRYTSALALSIEKRVQAVRRKDSSSKTTRSSICSRPPATGSTRLANVQIVLVTRPTMNIAHFSYRSIIAAPIAVAISWLRIIIKAACAGIYAIIAKPVATGYTSYTALSPTI